MNEYVRRQDRIAELEAEVARLQAVELQLTEVKQLWYDHRCEHTPAFLELAQKERGLRAKLVVVENCIQNLVDVEPRFAIQEWAKEICRFALAAIREGKGD